MGFRPFCLAAALLAALPAAAAGYRAPRTAFGAPDLQGEWTNASFTQLVRPKDFKALVATEAEAAAYVAKSQGILVGKPPPKDPKAPPPKEPAAPGVGDIESEWYEMDGAGLARIDGQLRTSWIVDPADGKLPYTEAGKAAAKAGEDADEGDFRGPCLLYTSPSPRDGLLSRMPSSA